MNRAYPDATPQGFLKELTSAVWYRRAGQIALAVVLAQAALRLISGFVAYLLVPFVAGFVNSNSESVMFASKPPYRWDPFAYLVLDFIVALIIFFYVGRALQPNNVVEKRSDEASTPEGEQTHDAEPETSITEGDGAAFTITGAPISPTEVERN